MNATQSLSGLVSDIQRTSVHDGPGLRTTVFLKGCQLCCPWCHNPESVSREPQELFYPEKCIGCGFCEDGCFSGARITSGRRLTVEAIMDEVVQDAPYYGDDGGITVSGGEPLCQPEFTEKLLSAARKQGIHTAIETNFCVPWTIAEPVMNVTDLLMADIKLWDDEEHVKWTGRTNAMVLENLRRADLMNIPIIIRTPVIPGVNDNADSIVPIAKYAKSLANLKYYELLAYHPLGTGKAAALGMTPKPFDIPNMDDMEKLAGAAAVSAGTAIFVGGVKYAG